MRRVTCAFFCKYRQEEEREGVRYVILRPDRAETVRRGLAREAREEFPLTEQVFADMWDMFAELGDYESHAVNTGGQTAEQTAAYLKECLTDGEFRLLAGNEA